MSTDSITGAGGLASTWAVWPDDNPVHPVRSSPRQAAAHPERREVSSAAELDVLQAKYELLARENELLRQRLAIADRQVEVKDSQILDFKAMSENLSRQNQVLVMLAQGVPMSRILKPPPHDLDVDAPRAHPAGYPAPPEAGRAPLADDDKRAVSMNIEQRVQSGMSHAAIAVALNEEGVSTFSGTGAWNRKKVGNALRWARKASAGPAIG